MQILLDTDTESREGLLNAARVIILLAGVEDLNELLAAPRRPQPKPLQAPPPPPIGPAPVITPPPPPAQPGPPPVEHPPFHPEGQPPAPPADVPTGTQPELDPATVFGGAPGPLVATAAAVPAAPPAGAPAAATVLTAPTGPASASDERDSKNLPWDARIHSETRKKNADGTWRYRRNLDPATKAAVQAELEATYSPQVPLPQQPTAVVPSAVPVPPAPASVPQPPAAAAAVPVPPPPAAGAVPVDSGVRYDGNTATVIPQPPAAAAVPVPPAPVVGLPNANTPAILPAVTSFRDLMQKVNTALAGGKLTQQQLTDACKAAGVDSVAALAAQSAKVPDVDAHLNVYLSRAA